MGTILKGFSGFPSALQPHARQYANACVGGKFHPGVANQLQQKSPLYPLCLCSSLVRVFQRRSPEYD